MSELNAVSLGVWQPYAREAGRPRSQERLAIKCITIAPCPHTLAGLGGSSEVVVSARLVLKESVAVAEQAATYCAITGQFPCGRALAHGGSHPVQVGDSLHQSGSSQTAARRRFFDLDRRTTAPASARAWPCRHQEHAPTLMFRLAGYPASTHTARGPVRPTRIGLFAVKKRAS